MKRQMGASAFVHLDNVTLRLDESRLMPGLNWTMMPCERWAVVGPTGAGKSVLARALCGRIPVVAGSIRYFFDAQHESRCWVKPGEVLRVGVESHTEALHVFAGYHQARWEANAAADSPGVADWMGFATDPDSAASKLLEVLGVRDLVGRKVLHLSYGEMRRALIARALLEKPRLLILDDPFGGVDAASREALRRSIEDLLQSDDPVLLILLSRPDELPEGITHLLSIRDLSVIDQGDKSSVLNHLAESSGSRMRNAECGMERQDQPERSALAGSKAVSLFRVPHSTFRTRQAPCPLIEIRNASVSYKEKQVLADVSWKVNPGEHWAVMGPNGSGKSTLLSLVLADNPQAYENDISLFGRRRGSGETVWEIKSRIGWVSSELLTYYEEDRLTCEQVVCSGFYDSIGLFRNCSRAQVSTARSWVESLGLTSLLGRPFRTASAGEKRLLLLARALVKSPEMLILDEPCLGLDSAHRALVLGLTELLCRMLEGSLIYVTHDPQEIGPCITHLLRLSEGRVVECGTRNAE